MQRADSLPAFPHRRRIGEGGIADVFESTWEGAPVAVKVLREVERPALRKRFLREGRLLGRLKHPGLPRCLAVIDDEPCVLVLELLTGEPLDRRLLRGPLTPSEAEHVASSLLDVLAYLHEQGIVHRDVKASNVWLGPKGRVVLMDLGLASDLADPLISTLGEVVGTHAYMAPEQIAGADSDHRCDLYSLGVTLYEALCGARPYQARGLAGYLQAHRSGLAVPLRQRVAGVPPRLLHLVDRLMAGDPARRPVTARVARAMLIGGAATPAGLQSPPLVGREGVRGAFHALLDAPGVLRISGEIGSGLGATSRLALEVARAEGVEYLVLRCRSRQTVADLAGQLAAALSRGHGPVSPDPADVRRVILGMIAESGRVLLVVEDFDLASESVEAWVGELAAMKGTALVVTGVVLPTRPAGREVRLRALTLEESRTLIGGMLGTTALPSGLDLALHRSCGGQPALMVATLREQVEAGVVWRDRSEIGEVRWVWDSGRRLNASDGATADLQRRLSRLTPGLGRLLAVLAVAGASLPLDVALEASELDPSGIDLGPLVGTGLVRIERHGDAEWLSARRVLVDPIVVPSLSPAERSRIHAVIAHHARALGEAEWGLRTAALHEALGSDGDPDRLLALAESLLRRGQPAEALVLLDSTGSRPGAALGLAARRAAARTDVLVALGRSADAHDALRAARALALEGDGGWEGLVLADAGWQLHVGRALPDGLVATLERLSAESTRAATLAALWRARAGDTAGAAEQFQSALGRLDTDERTVLQAEGGLAHLELERGHPEEAANGWRRCLAAVRGADRPIAAVTTRSGLAGALRVQGHLALALEVLNQAEAAIAGRDLPWAHVDIDLSRIEIEAIAGATPSLVDRLRALEACDQAGAPWSFHVRYLDLLAGLRLGSNDTQAALAVHLRAADAADAAGDVVICAYHLGMAGLLVADSHAVGDAVQRLTALGRPRYLGRVLAAGVRHGRDPDLFTAAEVEARASGDVSLLLGILHLTRGQGAREEAAVLGERLRDGLQGPLRRRLSVLPALRWALGEP